MQTRRRPSQALFVAPTSAALFAIALLVGGAALAGRMVTALRVYEPRPGLVCPNDALVDFARLTAPARWTPPHPDEQAFYDQRLRALASLPAPGPAAIQAQTHGTFLPGESTVTAVRSPRGVWVLTLDSEEGPPPRTKTHAQITLARSQGEALERLLANPCLYAEPHMVGNDFPAVRGGSATCFDGANTELNLWIDGRRRSAVQACGRYGLTGKLVRSLFAPLAGAPAQVSVVTPGASGR